MISSRTSCTTCGCMGGFAVTSSMVSLYWFYLQVFLGQNGGLDTEGNELPRLVYVSREKRPGFQHHKKAGAMNALVSGHFPIYLYSLVYDV